MKNFILFIGVAIALGLSACENVTQQSLAADESLLPIANNFNSTNLSAGQTFYFWAGSHSDPNYIKSWKLNVQADGSLSGQVQYNYPKDRSAISLYGIHGDLTTEPTAEETPFPTLGLPFRVETDQTDTSPGNYDKSDLIYGIDRGISPDRQTVKVSSYHMLSNIQIVLKAEQSSNLSDDDLQKATLRVLNTRISGQFVPDSTADLSPEQVRSDMIRELGQDRQAVTLNTKIVPKANPDFTGAEYGQAIVVPQLLPKGTLLIELELEGGAKLHYTLPEDMTLISGHSYQFNVTVADNLTAKTSIYDWTFGGPVPVPDTIQPKPGDFFYIQADGTWSVSDGGRDPMPEHGTCIGIVAYVGRHPTDKCNYFYKNSSTPMTDIHGYVEALFEPGNRNNPSSQIFQWSPTEDWIKVPDDNRAYDGYTNTNAMKAKAAADFMSDFPAGYWSSIGYEQGQGLDHCAPTNTSGWYLMGYGQTNDYILVRCDELKQSLAKAGGEPWVHDAWYWSSTPHDGSSAWASCMEGYTSATNTKTDYYRVRPMLTF